MRAGCAQETAKLWIYGIPGAGKTVLASASIEETIPYAAPEYGVAYYYCDYKTPTSQRLESILGCLAGQLAMQSEECLDILSKIFRPDTDQPPRHKFPDVEELTTLLHKLIFQFYEVAIIIDGVDEREDPSKVASTLSNLAARCAAVRLLVVSRDEVAIRNQLRDFEHLSIAARNEDLKLYVSAEIQERSHKGSLKIKNAALKDEILEELVNGADGM